MGKTRRREGSQNKIDLSFNRNRRYKCENLSTLENEKDGNCKLILIRDNPIFEASNGTRRWRETATHFCGHMIGPGN